MFQSKLDRLIARRTDPDITTAILANESFRHIAQSESVKYAIGAMQPIDPEYTANTFKEGERICNQLDKRLTTACTYRYQGSVANDTHIKAKSDIDILVIIRKFFSLEPPQTPKNPYRGDPVQDLLDLRDEGVEALKAAFPAADIDSTGSKSICIEGGSLRRKVDVVPSNWFDTNKYTATGEETYRGVQILDYHKKTRLLNTPFLHNALVEWKDTQTRGGLRKAARLMKSLKYDTDSIELSSYDIVSLAYSMPVDRLDVGPYMDLALVASCLDWCLLLIANEQFRESLDVPDGHRKIFCTGHATLQGLRQLQRALAQLQVDILQENQRSFRKLAEARVEY